MQYLKNPACRNQKNIMSNLLFLSLMSDLAEQMKEKQHMRCILILLIFLYSI